MNVRVCAKVNLAAIERNCRLLMRSTPRLCAVVKADGYGHGALPCAAAALRAGASMLAVASADEARELRDGGLDAPIIVLGALTDDELVQALACRCEVVAWTEEFLDAVVRHGGGPVHVKLDTGMGRFGTRDAGLADRLADRASSGGGGLELAGAMTHFATADETDRSFFREQIARFAAWVTPLRERHPGVLVHAENSAALLGADRTPFDMARCGVALYGLDPFGLDASAHGLEPALELHSWVAAIKPCAPGESAGYGRRFIARYATDLAVLPIGYGDGLRRVLSGNADVLIDGVRRELVGTISMDSATIDLGKDSGVGVGAGAVLIGAVGTERVSAEDLARRAGTINYEITCGLSRRIPREYHRDGVNEAAPNV
jgi:alanine racemase